MATRRLWVSGVSPDTTEADLCHAFGKHGEIETLRYEQNRNFATVTYCYDDDAMRAVGVMNHTLLNGSRISLYYLDATRSPTRLMEHKKKALFIEVDVQNDFVSGSLAVAQALEGQRLANMVTLSEKAPLLLGSVDSHDFRAWEFASNKNQGPSGEDPKFPDHCIVGTWGWLRVQPEKRSDVVFIPDCTIHATRIASLLSGTTSVFLMKEVYSLFSNPNAKYVLQEMIKRSESIDVVVYGIATDYCVKAAVDGLAEFGLNVHIVEDAIAAVDKEMGKVHVASWKAKGKGYEVIDTKTALERYT